MERVGIFVFFDVGIVGLRPKELESFDLRRWNLRSVFSVQDGKN